MRATEILRRVCSTCSDVVHAARFEAVLAVVEGLIRSQRLSLTAIGREASPASDPRHGIKRVDRLLGNPRLQRELPCWYAAVAAWLVRGLTRAVILIDWTQIQGDAWALVASVAFEGRSLPILARCHDKKKVGAREVQAAFVRELRQILPPTCRAVLVADGGFRSTFFEACKRVGFDYVIRLRNDRGLAEISGGGRVHFKDLFARATRAVQCLGGARPYASSQHSFWGERLGLGPKPPKAARRKRYQDDYERKRATEPFLLATSLQNEPAAAIVAIYAQRMQIEETFRDAKSARFGWALEHTGTSSSARLDVLMLIAALAMVAVCLVGHAAEALGLDKRLRASSVKRRVLSVFNTGNLTLRFETRSIGLRAIYAVLKKLWSQHRAAFPKLTWPRSRGRLVRPPLSHSLFCADCGWQGTKWGWPP